ncbi:FimV/HubP family polar landmark protein [Marinobacter sp.]|uniref:FimV/HubP family polar landmark protein n=1 Tax=Marinobacter sp. TaxID=50741 RepID=UPI0035C76BDB
MKVRKLAVALALAGGLGSGVAQALGLGELELQSYLNEPLDAEITLPQSRGINPADVFVNIASPEAYERVGLDRNQFLSKLRFQVVPGNDGRLIINVSSREPLREPYLNFLLELTWPNGRLLREYAVLVDPPVYAEESGVEEQVSAPTVSSTQTAQQPTAARSAESARRQARAEQSLSSGYRANTFGPTGPSDTLWTIASQVRPDDSVSMQQVMLAIQDLNPDAFMGNNINRLKRGEVLRIPSMDQIQSRSRAEATRLVAQQNQAFQSPRRTVDATAEQSAGSAAQGAGGTGGDELKLIVADDGDQQPSDSGSAGGDGQLPGGVDAGTAVAMEELESARRENAELNSRVEDLQDQVETLQRLLELKNTQLAEMQQSAATGDEAAEGAGEPADTASAEAEAGADAGASQTEAEVSVESGEQTTPAEGDDVSGDTADTETDGAEAQASAESTAEVPADTAQEPEQPVAVDADATADSDPSDLDDTSAETAPAATQPAQSQPEAQQPAPKPSQPAADKGFPGNIIDAITSNPMYQIALGGGLIVLLLLLLLLARRNANREKAFYEQLNSESDEGADSFDLSLEDEGQESAEGDAIAEADAYIAYGRHDQAAQTLENAISREPSRTDLRLKLLSVYADNQDRDSFEKQFGEIEALDDEDAVASANELRARLEEAESMPSIDDLESELRSDSFTASREAADEDESDYSADFESAFASETEEAGDEDKPASDELLADQFDAEKEEPQENEFGEFDTDFADVDLSEFEEQESDQAETSKEESNDDMIEFDLSGIELESDVDKSASSEEVTETGESGEWDLSSEFETDVEESAQTEVPDDLSEEEDLSLDFEASDLTDEETVAEEDTASDKSGQSEEESESDLESLDESFLDDLDAELDKVAGEDDELGGSEMEESSLDDLELDVSDEDLALMEEISDSGDSANRDDEQESLDEELGLEDALGEDDTLGDAAGAGPEETVESAEDLEQEGLDTLETAEESADASAGEDAEDEPELPVASDEVGGSEKKSAVADIDESELGDDDDFDFLAGTDEAATKLDLARAYIEMGDTDGARDILEEVALEGNEEQKAEAQDLLKNLS